MGTLMTRMLLVPILLFVFLPSSVIAQSVDWLQGFGDATGSTQIDMMHRLPDGSIVIAGSFTGRTLTMGGFTLLNAGQSDAFVAFLDLEGNVLHAMSIGGAGVDYASAVAADGEGNVYVGVCFESLSITIDGRTLFNCGEYDAALVKFRPERTVDWIWHVWNAGSDRISDIAVDSERNIMAAVCTYESHPTRSTITIRKLDERKTMLWERQATGKYVSIDAVAVDDDGSCYLGGSATTVVFDDVHQLGIPGYFTGFLVSYSADGRWRAGICDSTINSIDALAVHGRSVYAGRGQWSYPSPTGSTPSVIECISYDTDLRVRWRRKVSGVAWSTFPDKLLRLVRDMEIDNKGNVYLCGAFAVPEFFFAGDTLRSVLNPPFYYPQALVLVFDPFGNGIKSMSLGGNLQDAGSAVLALDEHHCIVAGTFESDTILAGGYSLTNTAATREISIHNAPPITKRNPMSFLISYEDRGTFIESGSHPERIALYPNPARDVLSMHLDVPVGALGEIRLYSTDGRLIESRQVIQVGGPLRLNVSALRPGMYLLVSQFGSRSAVRRFIRE
jgi:hypothetical protein